MTLPLFLELLVGGLVVGGLYALMAFSFSLILATTHVLNVAHGVFMVLGAAASTLLVRHLGLGVVPAFGLVAAGFLLVGMIFEAVLLKPMAGRASGEVLVSSILVTFGLALALEAMLGFYWARHVEPQPIFALHPRISSFALGDVVVSGPRATVLGIVAVVVGVLHLLLTRTRIGKEARAVAQNLAGALVIGLNPRRVSRAVLTIGIAAAALSGGLFVMAIPLNPFEGLRLTMIAFTVSAAGGVGNLPGALAAGIALGLAEVFTGFWAGPIWSPMMSLLVLFAVLLLRPAAILTGQGR
ncbi:MAG: branched-chain amino acid ABC transporter permease [Armatimonadota bacterium]|nr:branched-chain amino acid ABC transporter permease [Armatimonadota bacterium]MDR7453570.1 branched-chain amino acid ABC transporter permease [Armatimonadota bacterium]MDR7456384.1 branched-chain amino acid ABC transporter permease [Armatimonadota bacterium]MDR7496680.1 branched-chain amino acid ABC transporter permease [Armatimonadota bacterium]MDR7511498.1 branched-chain amino acid ABC transporter permease [Armatimonadota bacterium]